MNERLTRCAVTGIALHGMILRMTYGGIVRFACMAGIVMMLGACAHQPPPLKPYGPLPADIQADHIVIEKAARKMTLYRHGYPWKHYKIALGQGGLAPKQQEGDGLTPEGLYYIKNRNPQSIFYRSLRISYPNETDTMRAKMMGVQPGGNIMIHGLHNDAVKRNRAKGKKDWTQGCIAVNDREIEDIWNSVADGTPVEIRP